MSENIESFGVSSTLKYCIVTVNIREKSSIFKQAMIILQANALPPVNVSFRYLSCSETILRLGRRRGVKIDTIQKHTLSTGYIQKSFHNEATAFLSCNFKMMFSIVLNHLFVINKNILPNFVKYARNNLKFSLF